MTDRNHDWPARIRLSDREAFREMFHAHYGALCAFAAQYVGSLDKARDVVQEVFLTIWEHRADWTLTGSLKAYLYQAVRNRALNATRNRDTRRQAYAAHRQRHAQANHRTAEDDTYYHQLSEAVRRAVDELPARRRMVFLLHRRHDFTYREIAEIMDIAPKTVENQMGRALKSLRQRLSEDILSEL
ncbi:MAG: RNA polymerase sigma-70 factor [Bacteroidetes bacterium]|jgi:RNA polymerase sigma-70 factor (ECF subfamily)|nr:RNA polymerase sigma-70 factor [Bacteroidota bacterium]